ncbi:hypothetical protein TNCV_4850991 [Trichonephila clavipes]|nr:hypothetical protein TNCV_4850991 [Trichonephila clavipes]
MALRKGIMPDEIANFLRMNRMVVCSNLDSDEDIKLSESDCEESEESADIIDNIPVNPDIYISLGMAQNGYRLIVMFLACLRLQMFCDKAVV